MTGFRLSQFVCIWRHTAGKLERTAPRNFDSRSTLIVNNSFPQKLKIFLQSLRKGMEEQSQLSALMPPTCVRGMKALDRDAFSTTVKVTGFKIAKKEIRKTQSKWKPLLLKMKGLKPIADLGQSDPLHSSHSLILLDASKLQPSSNMKEKLLDFESTCGPTQQYELDLTYKNWSLADVMKAVLPEDADTISSFTQIGHIAHLNLKPETIPFKHLIGEVILDKIASVSTVVNKLNTIDNTYRNFQMELLAGEDNYVTQVKEHGCVFELDFSKVYWNSRLSTEHRRIVDAISSNSVVFDVFAGVGPFAIPLAKKRNCKVFANDLNPNSYTALKRNIQLNKTDASLLQTFNMDGRDFIRTKLKEVLVNEIETAVQGENVTIESRTNREGETDEQEVVQSSEEKNSLTKKSQLTLEGSYYVIMNLPALAIDFLDAFKKLLSDLPTRLKDSEVVDSVLPIVFCYGFCAKTEDIEKEVRNRAESVLQQPLPSDAMVRVVRNVAPNKEMVCLYFKMWPSLLFGSESIASHCLETESSDKDQEPEAKKQKTHP